MWSRDHGAGIQEDLEQSGVSTVRLNPVQPRTTQPVPVGHAPILAKRVMQGVFEH